jgi:Ca-activated chloride channel family protein
VSIAVVTVGAQQPQEAAQESQRTTFRSGLDLVSVAVVVRDQDGKFIKGLRPSDFEVLDRGAAREIVQFQRGEDAEARVALLVDTSGSMEVGPKRVRARLAAEFLMADFKRTDTASVFTFDSRVRRLTPFTNDRDELRAAMKEVESWGQTHIYDAIVGTVNSVVTDTPRPRAVLLLTDGLDTASVLSPEDAATAASAVDLPLYVLAVDNSPAAVRAREDASSTPGVLTLNDLAHRTGGRAAEATTIAQMSIETRDILSELRNQYVLAFPAATDKGWHELTVRVKRGRVQARSRNGYNVL